MGLSTFVRMTLKLDGREFKDNEELSQFTKESSLIQAVKP